MFHWILKKRALRRIRNTAYRFDGRRYRGQFGPGFLSLLSRNHFWGRNKDPAYVARRRWQVIRFFLSLGVFVFFAWVIFESVRAIAIF